MVRRVLAGVLFLIAYCGLELLGLSQTQLGEGGVFLWFATALLIAALLRAGRAQWPELLGLAMLGSVLASGVLGIGIGIGVSMAAIHAAEGLLAAYLIERRSTGRDLLGNLLAGGAAAGVVAPAAGAALMAALLHFTRGTPWPQGLLDYLLPHAVGNLVFLPFFNLILDPRLAGRIRTQVPARFVELLAFAGVLMLAGLAALGQGAFALYALPLLAVLLASWRLGRTGAATATVLLALVVCAGTFGGWAPAAGGAGAQFLQLFLAMTVLCGQLVAAGTVQRRRLQGSSRSVAELRRQNRALQESDALYRLIADNTTDIVLKTDRAGALSYASPALERLAGSAPGALIGRHIRDLAHPSSAELLIAEHAAALDRRPDRPWVEFRALSGEAEERWFEARMHPLIDERDEVYGAVGVLRNIEERKAFEERLFAAALTDPLTHLTNRRAFISMLQHLVDANVDGCLALFDIDYFKSINIQHGHAAGDKVLITFTDLVRTLVRQDDIISRVGDERFGILFPRATPDQAEAVCQRIVRSLADTATAIGAENLRTTVSAGVSRISDSLDETMKSAELALVAAKAKGRDRLEMATRGRVPWTPS